MTKEEFIKAIGAKMPVKQKSHPTGRLLTKAEQKEKTKDWPKFNKKAHQAGQKADKNWEMADRPTLTKGHQAYEKNK